MKTFNKLLLAGLLNLAVLTAMAQPQGEGPKGQPGPDVVAGATQAAEPRAEEPHHGCMMPGDMQPVNFHSVKICLVPQTHTFIAIDSVECSVHLIGFTEDGNDTILATYQTDDIHKRHDLKNILRPVSVGTMGPFVVVLASAVNDSSMVVEKGELRQKGGAYVALLDKDFKVVARRAFFSPMYAFNAAPGQMTVVGRNPYGYDINIIPIKCPGHLEEFENGEMLTHHYRVAKQAEKIKHSDPVGIGLTAVAVSVVFLALVCIALIISGSGKLIVNAEERKKNKGNAQKKAITPVSEGSSASSEQEVIAAIAAAIHLYNDELHDEEDTVITIQKVEREWTPWNAKYYNMNHYFNNRR